jgi:methylated-DNA-[protein]-cysteine S-methyltransferase
VVQGREGVVRVGFEEEPEDRVLAEVAAGLGSRILASDRELAATRDTLDAYFAGEGNPQSVPVDLSLVAAPFRHAVLETLHDSVPRGEVVSYGALAQRAGNPRAYRAAATACARNPIPILVPCHRVLPGTGGIGNYGGGPERKRALLELEGAI